MLAICFGIQSLNVWRGGSLVQDLTPLPVNHSAGSSVAIAHTALVAKDSLLAPPNGRRSPGNRWISCASPSTQPSPVRGSARRRASHRGPLPRRWGHRSRRNGCRRFGVPRGTSAAKQFVLGVQWHPERSFDISPASRALFARLVDGSSASGGPGGAPTKAARYHGNSFRSESQSCSPPM